MTAQKALSRLIAVSALALASQAQALTLSFDPSAAGLAGSAFTADTLVGTEVSMIVNQPPSPVDGSFAWQEIGYLHITGARLNGNAFVPVGLDSSYTLYIAFEVDGFQPNFFTPGWSTAANMHLYGANGVSSFGVSLATGATVSNASPEVMLAHAPNASVQTYANIQSITPLVADLSASVTADLLPIGGFISLPVPQVQLLGSFSHPSAGVEILLGGGVFLINGGEDVLTFAAAVPEPAQWALMVGGMLGLGGLRRRQRQR